MAETSDQITNALAKANLNDAASSAPVKPAAIPVPTSLPTTLCRSYNILGVPTDAWVQVFSDRIVVGVSQRQQKVGNWCLCHAVQSPVDPKAIDFSINTVLGDRNDAMVGVYARRITERVIQDRLIPGSNTMVIFLGISLLNQGKDPKMFQLVVNALLQLITDALIQMKS